MIRAVFKRTLHDQMCGGLHTEKLHTIVIDCPEIEKELTRGGFSQNGYEKSELVGIEILTDETVE